MQVLEIKKFCVWLNKIIDFLGLRRKFSVKI